MSFDASRFTFHPWNDYLGVIMQQGRVQLDADWNEWVAELNRRLQAQALDTMIRAVVPRTTPEGFAIKWDGASLTIGVGRMYVDGLLAENHGRAPLVWEKRLAEQVGTLPVEFLAQPYLPFNEEAVESAADIFNAPEVNQGTYLVYLDVWQREVTHLQAQDLVEKAVGVDTTGRLQTVWQVKTFGVASDTICSTADEDIDSWPELIEPSGARLSSTTGEVTGVSNPCLAPSATGYTGLENQLYRVEIHRGGPQAGSTFKWSRDNGTVAARVLEIHGGSRLVVDSLGRDEFLGFHAGDWVEVLDDWHELHNQPGRLHRIKPGNGIDQATRSITLEAPLPNGLFPVDGENHTIPERATRIRRWDQTGVIRSADGEVYHDLNSSAVSTGIPLPEPGTQLLLENGILVDFSQHGKAQFRPGDYWVFAARTADGTIDELYLAPPRGIHHHYARLAVVTPPAEPLNCRVFWPPEYSGESCDCTFCVDPEGHNSGAATIQQAIDSIRERGGGTICLDVGTYLLRAPLVMQGVRSLRLRGQGWRTNLRLTEAGRAIAIARGVGVTIENLCVSGITDLKGASAVIAAKNCAGLHLRGLTVAAGAEGAATAVAVELSGIMLDVRMDNSVFVAEVGVAALLGKGEYLFSADLSITNNIFLCSQGGIELHGPCLHYGQTRLDDNLLLNCGKFGFLVTGATLPQAQMTIGGNVLHISGSGVIGGTDGLDIRDNNMTALAGKAATHGIHLLREGGFISSLPLADLRLSSNTFKNLQGNGIQIQHRLGRVDVVANNVLNISGSALFMDFRASADYLRVADNRFAGLGVDYSNRRTPFLGLLLLAVKRADVVGNMFCEAYRQAEVTPLKAALAALATREIRISGNRFFDIGPDGFVGRSAAILLAPGFAEAMIFDNSIAREVPAREDSLAEWQALYVDGHLPLGENENSHLLLRYLTEVAGLQLEASHFAYLTAAQLVLAEYLPRLSVRGNCVRSMFSRLPTVEIGGVQSCLFNENDIEAVNGQGDGGVAGVVVSDHAGVNNNRLVAGKELTFQMRVAKEKFSLMGNLRTGIIEVNGIADLSLAPPWNNLNVKI